MQAEKYLSRIKLIDAIISNKKEEYNRCVKIAEGLGDFSVSERVQTSRNLHSGQNAIIKYIDIENEIKALEKERQAIIHTLEQLPPEEYVVLYDFYVKEYSLKEICYNLKKSYSWANKIKNQGLKHLQRLIDSL